MSNLIKGLVSGINERGDLITDITVTSLANVPEDDSVRVSVGPHQTVGIFATDHREPATTLIAVRGAGGYLEIGIVGMNLSKMLGIGPGEQVSIRW